MPTERAVQELSDDFLKEIKELKDLSVEKMEKVEKGLKTAGEFQEEVDLRLVAIEDNLKKQKKRVVGFPESDIRMLQFEPTQKGFDQFIRTKNPAGQANTPMGVLADEVRDASDLLIVGASIMDCVEGGFINVQKLRAVGPKLWEQYSNVVGELQKALDTATSGEGADWIPTGWSSRFQEYVALELRLAGFLETVNMPTDPWKWPFMAGQPMATFVPEQTSPTNPYDSLSTANEMFAAGKPTANTTMETVKHRSLQAWSGELDQDSIIAMGPLMVKQAVYGLARALEIAMVDGDVSGTHQDNDVTASLDARKSMSGWRFDALAAAGTKKDLGTLSTSTMRTVFRAMGVWGKDPTKTIIPVSLTGYWKLLDNTNLLTVDKYGPAATVVTGELGKFDNRTVVLSEFMRDDLNESGVYDGTTTNNTTILVVHTDSYKLGRRPSRGIETERLKITDQELVVAFQRVIMKAPLPSGSTPVAIGYNVDAT